MKEEEVDVANIFAAKSRIEKETYLSQFAGFFFSRVFIPRIDGAARFPIPN